MEETVASPQQDVEVVDIQFRPGQKVYYFDPAGSAGAASALRKARPFCTDYCAVTNRVTPNGVGLSPAYQTRNVSGHWPPHIG